MLAAVWSTYLRHAGIDSLQGKVPSSCLLVYSCSVLRGFLRGLLHLPIEAFCCLFHPQFCYLLHHLSHGFLTFFGFAFFITPHVSAYWIMRSVGSSPQMFLRIFVLKVFGNFENHLPKRKGQFAVKKITHPKI